MARRKANARGYRRSLDRIASEVGARAVKAARALDIDDEAERAALKEVMATAGSTSATAAAGVSAGFYNAVRVAQTGERIATIVHSGYTRAKTDEAVDALLAAYDETRDAEALMDGLADHVGNCTYQGARGCMGANGRMDEREVRWGNEPGDSDPCDYCVQIAAAGFYAKNPISQVHDHCKCSPVPGFIGSKSKVDGYDPKYWEERYEENKLKAEEG